MPKSDQTLKIFISYARKDGSAFAEELVDALDVAGFDAFLDRNDIAAGEDWEKRLEGLLAAADTVVFVLTPGSVASAQCAWELKTAGALSKRIIPVVLAPVPDADAPPAIARLNYIFFDGRQSFPRALKQLSTALTVDAEWIREHTRIGELAERWNQRGRPDVLLLRGPELEAARHWATSASADGPQPTELHRSFIDTSTTHAHDEAALEADRLAAVGREQAAKEEALKRLSWRTRLGLAASGTLALAAVALAIWSVNAEGRFREAQRMAQEAQAHSIDAQISMEAGRTDITGQLIAYATSPADIRLGASQRAAFTSAAVGHLAAPDTPLIEALTLAQQEMRGDPASPRPLLSTSLNGELYLGRPGTSRKLEALVVTAGSAEDDDTDADAWEAMLRGAGFTVKRLLNPTSGQFEAGLDTFLGQAATGPALQAESRIVPSAAGDAAPAAGPEANTLYFFVFVGQAARLDGQARLAFSDTDADALSATTAAVDSVATAFAARAAASVLVIDAAFTLNTGTATLTRQP